MPYKPRKKQCEHCRKFFIAEKPQRKFCSRKCSGIASIPKHTVFTEERKQKLSESIKKKYQEDPNYKKRISLGMKRSWRNDPNRTKRIKAAKEGIQKYTKGKFNKDPISIYEFSKRTISKIFVRMNLGCSLCGWDACVCDIHHINGRQIPNPDNHKNLTYVCPNCHRKIHNKLIDKKDLITLDDYIGDKWKKYYYG